MSQRGRFRKGISGFGFTALVPLSVALGAGGSLLFHDTPPAAVSLAVMSAALCCCRYPNLRLFALPVAAACWCLLQFELRLRDRLPAERAGELVTARGTIVSVPSRYLDRVRFSFRPIPGSDLPSKLLVTWYRDPPALNAGELWDLELRARPPWSHVNFQGADRERWLFAEGFGAVASVRSGALVSDHAVAGAWIHAFRDAIGRAIDAAVPDAGRPGVLRALAIADTTSLSRADRDTLVVTGTSHLLAISGLHIGLAALAGYWLGRGILLLIPMARWGLHPYRLCLAGSVVPAICYAMLANLGVSTLRAVAMLIAVAFALLGARCIHPGQALAVALAVVLLGDPFAPLGAGLWFSFLAVGALFWFFRPRIGRLSWWRNTVYSQVAVMLVLVPVSGWWFGAFSALGLAANLVAIPWVSVFLVPPILLGVCVFPLFPDASSASWQLAGHAAAVLLGFLEYLAGLQSQLVRLPSLSLLHSLAALTGALVLLLPRGINWKYLGLFLFLPLFLRASPAADDDAISIEVLDAGQGTSMVVTTAGKTLLYDTGPGDGASANLVRSVIEPSLALRPGRKPSMVVVSHEDLDHAGGVGELRWIFPDTAFWISGRDRGQSSCVEGWSWRWGGARFKALHPSVGLPYLGNDSSCTISVKSAAGSLLLPGDISAVVERRLLAGGISPHTFLLVPHHGSATSSSEDFIAAVNPSLAIATTALGNRFDFPRPEVRRRYQSRGIRFLTTGECGAIRLRLEHGEVLGINSARRERKRIWRWPPASNCP